MTIKLYLRCHHHPHRVQTFFIHSFIDYSSEQQYRVHEQHYIIRYPNKLGRLSCKKNKGWLHKGRALKFTILFLCGLQFLSANHHEEALHSIFVVAAAPTDAISTQDVHTEFRVHNVPLVLCCCCLPSCGLALEIKVTRTN